MQSFQSQSHFRNLLLPPFDLKLSLEISPVHGVKAIPRLEFPPTGDTYTSATTIDTSLSEVYGSLQALPHARPFVIKLRNGILHEQRRQTDTSEIAEVSAEQWERVSGRFQNAGPRSIDAFKRLLAILEVAAPEIMAPFQEAGLSKRIDHLMWGEPEDTRVQFTAELPESDPVALYFKTHPDVAARIDRKTLYIHVSGNRPTMHDIVNSLSERGIFPDAFYHILHEHLHVEQYTNSLHSLNQRTIIQRLQNPLSMFLTVTLTTLTSPLREVSIVGDLFASFVAIAIYRSALSIDIKTVARQKDFTLATELIPRIWGDLPGYVARVIYPNSMYLLATVLEHYGPTHTSLMASSNIQNLSDDTKLFAMNPLRMEKLLEQHAHQILKTTLHLTALKLFGTSQHEIIQIYRDSHDSDDFQQRCLARIAEYRAQFGLVDQKSYELALSALYLLEIKRAFTTEELVKRVTRRTVYDLFTRNRSSPHLVTSETAQALN